MIRLEPIEQEDFERFLERRIREYVEDHVRNGNWPAEGVPERSKKENGISNHWHRDEKSA
jgi:hypothetical protein